MLTEHHPVHHLLDSVAHGVHATATMVVAEQRQTQIPAGGNQGADAHDDRDEAAATRAVMIP